MRRKILLAAILASSLLFSCTENQGDMDGTGKAPTVTFSEDDLTYEVKVNNPISIEPQLTDATNAYYSWSYKGQIISCEKVLEFESAEVGQHYVTFTLDAASGSVEREICIDVLEITPPKITMPLEGGMVRAVAGRDTEIIPSFQFCDEQTTYKWYLDGEEIGSEATVVVNKSDLNDYTIRLDAENGDGFTRAEATLRISPVPSLSFEFDQEVYHVALGSSIVLGPYVSYGGDGTSYSWSVDGAAQTSTNKYLTFSPEAEGDYQVTISGVSSENSTNATVKVVCVAAEDHQREITAESSNVVKVFNYTPAPGQFVNRFCTATTDEGVIAYAEGAFNRSSMVTLGAWGGYAVVGFDHSVLNVEGKRDLWIGGNAFKTSNEPAVVWVMQDINGDGEPNDVWYEVKGSEYGQPETVQDYIITYYKAEAGEPVRWTDNCGNMNTVGINSYPAWITAESYSIRGTKIRSRTADQSSGGSEFWDNAPFEWGYADNMGSDYFNSGTEIELDNAINRDGTAANLEYIDFVKVQGAVNVFAGWLGEVSPEITGFKNLNL